MKSTLVFLFFYSLRWKKIVGAEYVDDKACDIEIPPLPTFTVEDGREGAIRFDLISNCSTTTDNGVVRLSQQDDSGVWWDQCVVYYPLDKEGLMIRQTCGCYAVKGPSHIRCDFLRTMSRKDNSPWKLYAIGATHINEKRVIVNVIYQPNITQFAIGSHNGQGAITVNEGAGDIDVNCSFTNGNPPRSVRILGPRNRTQARSNNRQGATLHTTLYGPECSHSGLYICEVDDTYQRQSAVLLIRCPLTIVRQGGDTMLHVAPGENAVLELRTRSHAKENLTCTLSHLASSALPSKQVERTCDGDIHVSGSPPDVHVSLSFFNVSYNDTGTWRLSLSNDVKGTDHVNFTLNVVSAPAAAGSVIVVVSVVTGHAVVFIVVIIVVIACKKGSLFQHRQRRRTQPGGIELDLDDLTQRNSRPHIYEEVLDDPRPPRCLVHKKDLGAVESRPVIKPLLPVPSQAADAQNRSNDLSGEDAYLHPTARNPSAPDNQPSTPSDGSPGTPRKVPGLRTPSRKGASPHSSASPVNVKKCSGLIVGGRDITRPTPRSHKPTGEDAYLHPVALPCSNANNQ